MPGNLRCEGYRAALRAMGGCKAITGKREENFGRIQEE